MRINKLQTEGWLILPRIQQQSRQAWAGGFSMSDAKGNGLLQVCQDFLGKQHGSESQKEPS